MNVLAEQLKDYCSSWVQRKKVEFISFVRGDGNDISSELEKLVKRQIHFELQN